MIRSGPISKANRIAAWILAVVCVIAGSIGMGITVAHVHWRLGLAALCVLCLGVAFGIAAARGRPLNDTRPQHRVAWLGAKPPRRFGQRDETGKSRWVTVLLLRVR
jgi:hypothetical protein